ncbi:MAG: M48 family metalloprotease [Leptolyngbyaceae cyanobacterium]
MKTLKRLLLVMFGAVLFIGGSWQLPNRFMQPAQSIATPARTVQEDAGFDRRLAQISGDRVATFLEGDRLYRQGDVTGAEQLYRQVKPEFESRPIAQVADPIYEASALAPENLSRWTAAETAIASDNQDAAIPPLQQVVEAQPEFIPAPLQLAALLQERDRKDEALVVLEQAATLYPYAAELVMAQVRALSDSGQHLEASIAAREFSIINLDHPQAGEFADIAEEELNTFSSGRRTDSIVGGVVNILGGILTGDRNPLGSWNEAVETYEIVDLMLSDESEFGAKVAEQYKQQLTLVEDPVVVDYVTQLGLEVSRLMGRDLDYEFFVVQNSSMNAFALPGGKIFVYTGAIAAANSQAELAGVLAHEAAHAVFSHGIQSFFRDDLLAQLSDEIPLGDFVTNLVSLHYSREQERQSDLLGTRVLATAGYAADGLRNFMATLGQNSEAQVEYLSSHPVPASRVAYLEELIQRNGYNRYSLEGMDRHLEILARL